MWIVFIYMADHAACLQIVLSHKHTEIKHESFAINCPYKYYEHRFASRLMMLNVMIYNRTACRMLVPWLKHDVNLPDITFWGFYYHEASREDTFPGILYALM